MDADQPPPQRAACTHRLGLREDRLSVNTKVLVSLEPDSCDGVTIGGLAARHQLPQHQAHGVHVDSKEGVSLEVDGSF